MLVFRERVIKPRNLRVEAMHPNVYARGCNWLLGSFHRGFFPGLPPPPPCPPSPGRNVIGAPGILNSLRNLCLFYSCRSSGPPAEADGTPMIMGYRCCSTSRPLMGMQKRRDIGPGEKSAVWRDAGVGGTNSFSCHAGYPILFNPLLSLPSSREDPLSTVLDVFSRWSNRIE